jgi:hypothetical protein
MNSVPPALRTGSAILLVLLAGTAHCDRPRENQIVKPPEQRLGLYLHACWHYAYPFAVRTWQRDDYTNMFHLLKIMGYNTVMFFPCVEAVPAPISKADREDLMQFRATISDAQKCGLESWLVMCAVTVPRSITSRPWRERSFYTQMVIPDLDDPEQAEPFLKLRGDIIQVINNADGYVTIDGDPGSYPGATPAAYVKIFLNDRQAIDRYGTHPKAQKVVPWIWAGWGIDNAWTDTAHREPYVMASLEAIKQVKDKLGAWELLPGRHAREDYGSGRGNFECVKKAGMLGDSTLLCYDLIEFEPSPPAGWIRFDDIRRVVRQEMELSPGGRGWFGNTETPILMIPNVYFYARVVKDPSYLDRTDEQVLTDLANLLGGPADLLVPAWLCLNLGLDKLPTDLPAKLRAAKLTGAAAKFIPSGSQRYLSILAQQVETRIRLLQVCQGSPQSPEETAAAIADGVAALVDWWKLSKFTGLGDGTQPFNLTCIHRVIYGPLKDWCGRNVSDSAQVSDMAVEMIVERKTLDEKLARGCLDQLLARS